VSTKEDELYEESKYRIGDKVEVKLFSEVADEEGNYTFQHLEKEYTTTTKGTISDYVEDDDKIVYIIPAEDGVVIYHRNEDEIVKKLD
jgi:protein-tyrosine phosphatase